MKVPGPFAFSLIFLLSATLLARLVTGSFGLFVTPFLVFVMVPLADLLIGRLRINPTPEEEPGLAQRRGYDWLLWSTVPLQLVIAFGGTYASVHHQLGTGALVDLTLSVGLMSGIVGITTAHELVHRRRRFERALGFVSLASVGYMHWGIEHVHGHHRWVATPHDPVSARRGQSLYAFIPRALLGELISAWNIEKQQLAKRALPALHPRNRLLQFAAVQAGIAGAVTLLWGPRALVVWLAQGLIAAVLLQVINYVEHYGLARRELRPGVYERVTAAHSWNASERLTNLLLFNLQRHADHHAHAARPYQLLRHLDDSPQLPSGYAAMLLLALVPPLWFRVMDPRVAQTA